MSGQKLGQHFLHSPAWRERIARTLPADANATWLEIGPGHGEMTEFLAQHARRVIAIETDAALASTLRQRAAGLLSTEPTAGPRTLPAHLPAKAAASAAPAAWSNVEIVEADILSVNLAALVNKFHSSDLRQGTVFYPEKRRATVPQAATATAPSGAEASPEIRKSASPESAPSKRFVGRGFSPDINARFKVRALAPEGRTKFPAQNHPETRFRVYGNLPYYITSPILSHLFHFAAQIDSVHIVIQYEVAARIAAAPGHREYAYLSALCQYFAHPQIVLRIPSGAFRPPPKVNSALVAMNLPGERAQVGIRDDASFLKFLQDCFSQKRKTLRNNLKNIFTDSQIAAALAACKLTPKARAEEVSLAQFAQLYRQLAPPDCHSEEPSRQK